MLHNYFQIILLGIYNPRDLVSLRPPQIFCYSFTTGSHSTHTLLTLLRMRHIRLGFQPNRITNSITFLLRALLPQLSFNFKFHQN